MENDHLVYISKLCSENGVESLATCFVLKEKLAVACLLTVPPVISTTLRHYVLEFSLISFTMVMVGKLTNRFIVYCRLIIINSSLADKSTA